MITLFGDLESGNDYKVRLLLSHLGLPYRRVTVRQQHGEPRRPEFLVLNPIGKIPAVQFEDGTVLTESGALLYHFAQDTPYWPDDTRTRSEVLRWLFFEQYSHEPHIAVNRYYLKYAPPSDQPDDLQAVLARNHRKGMWALEAMNETLASRPGAWIAGDGYSIADIALYAYTHNAAECGFDLDGFDALRDWLDAVAAQRGHIPMSTERATQRLDYDEWAETARIPPS